MTDHRKLRESYRSGLSAQTRLLQATDEGRIAAVVLSAHELRGEDKQDRDLGLRRIAESPTAADLAGVITALEGAAVELSRGIANQTGVRASPRWRGAVPTWLRRSGFALAAGLAAFALFGVQRNTEVPASITASAAAPLMRSSFEAERANASEVFRAGFD